MKKAAPSSKDMPATGIRHECDHDAIRSSVAGLRTCRHFKAVSGRHHNHLSPSWVLGDGNDAISDLQMHRARVQLAITPALVSRCLFRTWKPWTLSPSASISPQHSKPSVKGVFGGLSTAPWRTIRSWKFIPLYDIERIMYPSTCSSNWVWASYNMLTSWRHHTTHQARTRTRISPSIGRNSGWLCTFSILTPPYPVSVT